MTLRTIFEKPVDRPIEGVIKADDEASLILEIEEYVLTNEIEKRLESFLDAYNNYEGANGVWISGFFGSGKSHLLKILALLMENREIDNIKALDIFLPKCGDNEILRGGLKRAVAIPSKSILFNIDQKADIISKTQTDALLAVFVKVFDESCGYYGKQPYIAQFERELDQDGLFDNFKDKFKENTSHDWEWGRMRAKRVASDIDHAYNAVTDQKVSGILDKYRSDYRLSIEDFADQVNNHIEAQEKGFRLNFFVDEVGQYVADNIKLMTNLQTVAESLATKSRGRAWVIITAQEDMSSVIGEMDKQQGNDFSKIQARFANRMKLTSANVDEVIQKRLLQKNKNGIELLSTVYKEQVNNFKTLFDFSDGSQFYRNFRDQEHFIHSYPFIPYQFTLFQTAIQNFSMHNAFEGKHSSVGERSMLGVFQQVAVRILDQEIGQLATFDLMFEGIRSVLKAQIQRSIHIAEQNLDNKFAVQVLKALFLVKYIKEFKATQRNLIVLMYNEFGKDMEVLNTELTEALNLLESQTYIQRNGEIFEFLTDEEKDIEDEIKNTDIDTSTVEEHLNKIIFENIIKQKKIRYDENGQDYSFSKKLDDRLFGRESELTIHVITPFHEHVTNEQTLIMQSVGRDELLVIMPPDERMMRDLLMYERTDKYIRQNISITQQDSVKKILAEKTNQNTERFNNLKQHIQNLVGKSKLFISQNIVDAGGEDPQARIIKGFHDLIIRTYPNLKMLLGFTYTESYVVKCLKETKGMLTGDDAVMLSEAEQEMLSFIKGNKAEGTRTTLKNLIARFEQKPFGWYYAAILCILAKLCAAGKIELNSDGNILEDDQLEKALLNTHGHSNLILDPLSDFTASQIRSLKEFYEDFFDAPPSATEAKALGKETASAFKDLIERLSKLASDKFRYPFLSVLDKTIEKLNEFQSKPYTYYLTDLHKTENDLLDLKEDIIDPIQRFMSGSMKKIYDDASNFLKKQEHNFSYIDGDEHKQISEIVKDLECYKGNRIQKVRSLIDSLRIKIENLVLSEKVIVKDSIKKSQVRLQSMDEFSFLKDKQKKELENDFDVIFQNLDEQFIIAIIKDTLHCFEESGYHQLLSKMSSWIKSDYDTTLNNKKINKISEKKVKYVSARTIHVSFDKAWLASDNDINQYLSALRKAMQRQISQGKRIQV